MHRHSIDGLHHDHEFLGEDHLRKERGTRIVVALSLVTMMVEVAAGLLLGSMALLADGLHMAGHVGALGLAAAAYAYARRHKDSARFAFGTGKVGDLAAFASGVAMALTALLVFWESLDRLASPVPIRFDEAIAVAALGLAVNIAGAWVLHDRHHHSAGAKPHAHHDHNHRAAYLHVLADALTSVLAILALLAGRWLGSSWMDPAVGLVGALVLGGWAFQLMKDSGAVLVDAAEDPALALAIRRLVESRGDRLADLHVWRVGPGHSAAILSVVSNAPLAAEEYRSMLTHLHTICHVTVEVHRAG